jgi:hypothetical protein
VKRVPLKNDPMMAVSSVRTVVFDVSQWPKKWFKDATEASQKIETMIEQGKNVVEHPLGITIKLQFLSLIDTD